MNIRISMTRREALGTLGALALSGHITPARADETPRWWRGNLHTHTFWSDGDDFPENVAQWYKENGYHFLAYTDHNLILEGEKWKIIPKGNPAVEKYRALCGEAWIQTRKTKDGQTEVRVRPLNEFRAKFEQPQRFLLIMGNEISNQPNVHLGALHQDLRIPQIKGEPLEIIRTIVKQVKERGELTGRPVHAILNHPNFNWGVTAEEMAPVADLRFFEVHNTHPSVRNEGDAQHPDTDRIWDIVLALRLGQMGGRPLYGLATDDAHNYHGKGAGPGRGWIMVRSATLDPEALLTAMNQGDFYASTGVTLRDMQRTGDTLRVEIDPKPGVTYRTEYMGTLKGTDLASQAALNPDGTPVPHATRVYSPHIGAVLAHNEKTVSSYTLTGREMYVRARITASETRLDPVTGKALSGFQQAWTQPLIPPRA